VGLKVCAAKSNMPAAGVSATLKKEGQRVGLKVCAAKSNSPAAGLSAKQINKPAAGFLAKHNRQRQSSNFPNDF
jgi:hypothetical protein